MGSDVAFVHGALLRINAKLFLDSHWIERKQMLFFVVVVVRCHNVKIGKEASEDTEGKSIRMRWGR